jgi:hypothetical protein
VAEKLVLLQTLAVLRHTKRIVLDVAYLQHNWK